MDITPEDSSAHRLYDIEIIDLTPEVSFIVICPSAELSCSVPGQREILLQRGDLLSLPIQVFEIIHLKTYQAGFIQKFSKLSSLLELDAATANHLHREAFSNTELAQAKERLATLHELQTKLNNTWRCARWLMDVITFARDRATPGISVKWILEKENTCEVSSPKKRSLLLEIPATKDSNNSKSMKGRGSWPGPTSNTSASSTNGEGSLYNEFSKSEQHLSTNDGGSPFLSVAESRNSESFNGSAATTSNELIPGKTNYYYNHGFNELSKSEQHLSRGENLSGFYSIVENPSHIERYKSPNNSRQIYSNEPFSSLSRSDLHLNLKDSVSKYLDVTDNFSSKYTKRRSNSGYNERLIPSKSEDALFAIPGTSSADDNHRGRSSTISTLCSPSNLRTTASADTSPNLDIRPTISISPKLNVQTAGSLLSVNTLNTTSNSVHSLSSDSDTGCHAPLSSSTPNKIKEKRRIPPSKSMTNVKQSAQDIKDIKRSLFDLHSDKRSLFDDYNVRLLDVSTKSAFSEPFQQHPLADSHLSKSLTNIKTIDDSETILKSSKRFDYKTKKDGNGITYLKPMNSYTKTELLVPDSVFKIPEAPSTSSNGKESQSGILQVYAAYETGLANGTSLKLHVTPKTTAREVVDLVVRQLNMAVVLKGKPGPIYPPEKLKNFCLVAVIGARERCLRDDFKPLQLQNPWKKGRLYVRQKQDVLAALEHSSKHSAVI